MGPVLLDAVEIPNKHRVSTKKGAKGKLALLRQPAFYAFFKISKIIQRFAS